MDACFAEVGYGQPRSWMEDLAVYIPELGRVFGANSAFAWYGTTSHHHGGPWSYRPNTYLEALEIACGTRQSAEEALYAAAAEVDQ